MRISDWSSDVCSSDLTGVAAEIVVIVVAHAAGDGELAHRLDDQFAIDAGGAGRRGGGAVVEAAVLMLGAGDDAELIEDTVIALILVAFGAAAADEGGCGVGIGRVIVAVDVGDRDRPAVAEPARSEEHTSELQSLMRISYAV